MHYPGVYETELKDGTKSYRASLTHKGKHIALGSFSSAKKASKVYEEGRKVLKDKTYQPQNYRKSFSLPFDKYISLINLRDNRMYFANPIYLEKNYFSYYLSPDRVLRFDSDDLFYYSMHRIMKRGKHLFIDDYGSQISLPGRYGIRNYAIEGKDYRFVNGDHYDYRHANIEIFNPYYGIEEIEKKGVTKYRAKIHVNGYFIVGVYNTQIEAAIAYNKAADILKAAGVKKNYAVNYIDEITQKEYADIYEELTISETIRNYTCSC